MNVTMADFINLTNQTGIAGVFDFANQASNGILFGFGLVAFFIITLLALKKFGFLEGLVAASWIWFIPAAIMANAGWIGLVYPLSFLIIAALSSMYLWTRPAY